ncbi:MAG: FAD-dependent oxidoreductase [Deltaproteobacteria bacterium]|nr:MAG: FAD-dependent oxidoreductase [Deltaproteobacteria bacterium]
MEQSERPIRVAIVGGGCAGVTAAFELTRPEHRGRYEVTVYQLGWRLGGKGASGRGVHGRIEEHGLHVWMGWYENAFQILRECYRELDRDFLQAFIPATTIAVTERDTRGQWELWMRSFPPMEGLPGDIGGAARHPTVRDYIVHVVALVRTLFADVVSRAGEALSAPRVTGVPESAAEALAALVHYGELATLAGITQGLALLEVVITSFTDYPGTILVRFLDAAVANARRLLESRLENDPELRRIWQVIDLALATVRGQIRFGLVNDPRGFDAIDDYDCREWLLLNGAAASSVDSGYLRGLYGLGFAYEDGDFQRPRVSAGVALRGFLRAFFTYRGAIFWKMRGGMGDVVFAPLYEVLRRRGVRFAFFHRLRNVRVAGVSGPGAPDAAHVEALDFDVQAEIRDGQPYEPLVTVQGMPAWPSCPDYHQLVDGDRFRHESWDFESHWDERCVATRSLRVGDDFDLAVLAVGIGAIPYVCRDLVGRDPRWREMVDHVRTVATHAFQLWLRTATSDLGWPEPPITLSGFAPPFDTCADMRHLLPLESWPSPPIGLVYFCSVLPDDGDYAEGGSVPARKRELVRALAVDFLRRQAKHLWPRAIDESGEFRWDLLATPVAAIGAGDPAGEGRFATQFWTANVNPSDRYTLALPGSSKYRISPLDATYDNLTIAGDWTECGVNTGCVEAAVISGRLAAHAIARAPRLEDIMGYDHP